MNTQKEPNLSLNVVDEQDEQVDQVLARVFKILAACGLSKDELLRSATRVLQDLETNETGQNLAAPASQHLACTELVFQWRRNARFADETGRPAGLPLDDGSVSFSRLCATYAPGFDETELLEYMQSLGVVRVGEGRVVDLVTESVLACSGSGSRTFASKTILSHIQGFLGTVENNLSDPPGDDGSSRYERACYALIPKALVPVFERLVESRGQILVDTIDEWLDRHRFEDQMNVDGRLVGVGAYAIVHDSNLFK